jgi:hypothetical protein
MRRPIARYTFPVRFALASLAALFLLAGCEAASPRAGGSEERATAEAVLAREAALDRDPLSAAAAGELARALVLAGRPGRGYALWRTAIFLAENAPPARAAFPAAFVRELERSAEAARRLPAPRREPEEWAGGARGGRAASGLRDPRLCRPGGEAAREIELAGEAARAGRDEEAIERIWRAADLDPAARGPALFREIARLERRRALAAFSAEKPREAEAALRRAFRALPEDRDTLFLLARRGAPEEAACARAALLRLYSSSPEAHFVIAAERALGGDATALVSAGAAVEVERPEASAEASRLLAEREAAKAAREAEAARARYDRAREAAARSREALEGVLVPAAGGAPLFRESFDDAAALGRWKREIGASTGDGETSAASIDEGALRLEAGPATKRFFAFERNISLSGAAWIRVSARIRTDKVDASAARFKNCNLYVKFPGGPVVAPRVFAGTNPWTPFAARYRVPPGAKDVTIGLFLSMPGRVWFDDVVLEAVPDFIEEREGRYVYRFLPGDAVPTEARRFNEASLRIVEEFLGVEGPRSILFVKYPDLDAKEEYVGLRGNAHARGENEIHSIFPSDRHEIVHILARAWGNPPPLLAEGLAVHLSGAWQGRPVAEYARGVLEKGSSLALADLLDAADFRAKPDLATYAIAGAFVEWILETHGKSALKTLYGKASASAPVADLRRAIEEVLGMKVEEADARVREWLFLVPDSR